MAVEPQNTYCHRQFKSGGTRPCYGQDLGNSTCDEQNAVEDIDFLLSTIVVAATSDMLMD